MRANNMLIDWKTKVVLFRP